jgi:ribonuclease E
MPNRNATPSSEDNARATLVSRNFAPPAIEAFVPEPLPEPLPESLPAVDLAEDTLTTTTADLVEQEQRPGKPQRVKPTRPTIEPPEVIAVEMSDLEKETYAWMGISPLIKSGQELNNPKTAIINIVPIGSLPPAPAAIVDSTVDLQDEDIPTDDLSTSTIPADDSAQIVAEVVETSPEPEAIDEVVETPPQPEAIDEVVETHPQPETVDEVVETDAISIDPEPVEPVTIAIEPPEELPENRRRKRRSSATVD